MIDYIFKVRTDGDIIDNEDRVIGHINLEYIKSIAENPQCEETEKCCKNCFYYENNYGYGQCYARKGAPSVLDIEVCGSWKRRTE